MKAIIIGLLAVIGFFGLSFTAYEVFKPETASCTPNTAYYQSLRTFLANHYNIGVARVGFTQANQSLEGHWIVEFVIEDDIDGFLVDQNGFIIDDEITGFYGPAEYLTKENPCGSFDTQFIIDDEIEGF